MLLFCWVVDKLDIVVVDNLLEIILLLVFIKLVMKGVVGCWYIFFGVLVCLICFWFNIVMWFVIIKVFCWLWVIINDVNFSFFCRDLILWCIFRCILVFRLDNGLFNISIWGFMVRVFVSVICCCWLFDSLVIFILLSFLRLIICSSFVICCVIFVLCYLCSFRL